MPGVLSSSPEVIAHIQGGLGNQLFSYAAARALAWRNSVPLRINSRDGFRREKYGRDYLLSHLRIEALEAEGWRAYRGPLGRWRRSLGRRREAARPIADRALIHEPADQSFVPELLELRVVRPIYLVGYWQHEEYFRDAAEVLRREFQLRSKAVAAEADAVARIDPVDEVVSIHCRSYREVPNLKPSIRLDGNYYGKAIESVLARVPQARLVCFSDDPQWARELLDGIAWRRDGGPPAITYPEPPAGDPTRTTLIDFFLMSRCKHHVVANSSFSWWTAWLGEQENSVIVVPSGGPLAKGARFPERWLRVQSG